MLPEPCCWVAVVRDFLTKGSRARMNRRNSTAQPIEFPTGAVVNVTHTRRWAIVWLLFVASFINYLDRATLSVALPLISKDLGLSAATKGLLLSAFFWSYALMQVPIGWCA